MDDYFLNNSLLDLDLQEQNCINPDIVCGFEIHKQPSLLQSDSIMFNIIPLNRVSGYPTEDAESFFLSSLKAYATFNNSEPNDRRQAVVFQLHLEWFASLDDDITCHWTVCVCRSTRCTFCLTKDLFLWLKRNIS